MENLVRIGKTFRFEASHQLPNEECYGVCSRVHGHSYKLIVEVEGNINEKGWVLNFKDLKKIVNEKVIDVLDHQHLNNFIDLPTAENIVFWIYRRLKDSLNLSRIILYETEGSYAELNCK